MNKKRYCRRCNFVSSTGLFVTFVVWILLAAPMVSAVTTPTPGDGDTAIQNDGSPEIWLAYCDPPNQCNVAHEDDTNVYVTMTADWVDDRDYPSEERRHNFTMIATYGVTGCDQSISPSTYGEDGDSDLLGCTVNNVGVNTYMSVYYNATIYNPITHQVLGYLEGTSLFHFVR